MHFRENRKQHILLLSFCIRMKCNGCCPKSKNNLYIEKSRWNAYNRVSATEAATIVVMLYMHLAKKHLLTIFRHQKTESYIGLYQRWPFTIRCKMHMYIFSGFIYWKWQTRYKGSLFPSFALIFGFISIRLFAN